MKCVNGDRLAFLFNILQIITEVDDVASVAGGDVSSSIDIDGVNSGDNDQRTLADKIDMYVLKLL